MARCSKMQFVYEQQRRLLATCKRYQCDVHTGVMMNTVEDMEWEIKCLGDMLDSYKIQQECSKNSSDRMQSLQELISSTEKAIREKLDEMANVEADSDLIDTKSVIGDVFASGYDANVWAGCEHFLPAGVVSHRHQSSTIRKIPPSSNPASRV